VGKYAYLLTFCTCDRSPIFTTDEAVTLVRMQFVRAARQEKYDISTYCFMPDHLHVLIRGLRNESSCRAFIKAAKQFSGYYFSRRFVYLPLQRYGFERAVRDDAEFALAMGYIIANPVRAGLVRHPADYPYTGSESYTMDQMLAISEYVEHSS
jgi:putative transposase